MTNALTPRIDVHDFVRFLEQVEITQGCWNWMKGKDKDGYGDFWHQGKSVPSHRFAYSYCVGVIPKDMLVLHHCDNPSCVKPTHLFLGTQKDNCADAHRKGRGVKGVTHGKAKLTEDAVRRIRTAFGQGISRSMLAATHKVSYYTIWDITEKRSWKHLN